MFFFAELTKMFQTSFQHCARHLPKSSSGIVSSLEQTGREIETGQGKQRLATFLEKVSGIFFPKIPLNLVALTQNH
jgi:hypothetical protein